MFGILPLIFALVIAQTAEGMGAPSSRLGGDPWLEVPLAILASCLAWWGLVALAANLAARSRSVRLLSWWDATTTGAALGLFALWCYGLGWTALAPWSSLLQLAPYCALLIAAWWSGGRAWSGGHGGEARELVAVRVKFGLLPALVALTLFDAVRWLVIVPLGLEDPAGASVGPLLGLVISIALVLAVILLMPAVVVRLWGARRMPPGPERELIEDGCRQMKVRVRGILHWPSAGGRFYNAAAMGLVPHLRYVLFSDDLIRELPPDELRAVLGHELGHIRHGHLWIYLAFLVAAVSLSWTGGLMLAGLIATVPGFAALGPDVHLGLGVLAMFVVLLRGVFGLISRACERQADLAGVELAGDPEAMRQALLSVARLSGQPLDAPSWRHHSIRERVTYLARVDDDPEEPRRHGRRVRGMTLMILAVLAMGALFAVLGPRTGIDPDEWFEQHPAAAEAIEAAEAGETAALTAWLEAAEPEAIADLTRLIQFHLAQRFERHQQAIAEGTAERSEAEVLYDLRGLLYPLVHHPTGIAALDATIANNAAYAAVAGTAEPTEQDLATARAALPVVNRAAFAGEGSAVLHDTVGCVLFRLGNREQARRHFDYALEQIDQVASASEREAFERLLQRRIAACSDPDAELPLEPPP